MFQQGYQTKENEYLIETKLDYETKQNEKLHDQTVELLSVKIVPDGLMLSHKQIDPRILLPKSNPEILILKEQAKELLTWLQSQFSTDNS